MGKIKDFWERNRFEICMIAGGAVCAAVGFAIGNHTGKSMEKWRTTAALNAIAASNEPWIGTDKDGNTMKIICEYIPKTE